MNEKTGEKDNHFWSRYEGKRMLDCVGKEKVAYFVDSNCSKKGKQIE